MVGENAPVPNGHADDASGAPGDLEHVRAFMALHDHVPGSGGSLPPSADTIATWLVSHGLATPEDVRDLEALRWASTIRDAMRARVPAGSEAVPDPEAATRLDAAAREVGLELRFSDTTLMPSAFGIRGGVGRLLATAFLAERDGTWQRLRHCANGECTSIFFDRSRNRSGRWCSMRVCGNQAKVRAYRERHKGSTA